MAGEDSEKSRFQAWHGMLYMQTTKCVMWFGLNLFDMKGKICLGHVSPCLFWQERQEPL